MKRFLSLFVVFAWAATASAYGFRTGQASVTTVTPVLIGTASDRVAITIFNTDGTNPIYCGATSAVTSSTGLKIPAGIGFTMDGNYFASGPEAQSVIYCVATGGTVTATYLEGIR